MSYARINRVATPSTVTDFLYIFSKALSNGMCGISFSIKNLKVGDGAVAKIGMHAV